MKVKMLKAVKSPQTYELGKGFYFSNVTLKSIA